MQQHDPIEIDAIGLLCPWPVLRLQRALRSAETGAHLRLTASDPMAEIDVPHFCKTHNLRLHKQTTSPSAGPNGCDLYIFELETA